MSLYYLIKTAIIGLKTNKSRSALTILGIVIGITAIMLVMSLGKGAESIITKEIQGFGAKTVSIEPGKDPTSLEDVLDAIYTNSLKEKDLLALQKKSHVRGLTKLSPMVISSTTATYQRENIRGQIVGGDDFYLNMLNVAPEQGTMFGESEIKQMAHVTVIGWEVKQELFGFAQAVGEKIKINNQNFKVIGVLPKSGTMMGFDVDKMVLVPYTTAQKYILGIDYYHAILGEAEHEDMVQTMAEDIRKTIRETHGISDPSKDDFRVITMDDAAERVGAMLMALTVLLVSASAISLVVGGVGIMNIMLVSVTERTHEIGLRKAVGATSRDIMYQFLIESILLTGIGGLIGIGLGSSLSYLITYGINNFSTLSWDFVFPMNGAVLGLGVSGVVGLVFGIYPAREAAKKSPIEALRYE